jgi:hypothetical protein
VAVQIFLGGVDVGSKRLASSALTWSDQVNGQGSLSIAFRDVVGGFRPLDGQELLVVENAPVQILTADGAAIQTSDAALVQTGPTHLFGGILLQPVEHEEVNSGEIFFDCTASEYSAICDRRLVTAIYENQALDAIVRDIVNEYLDGEGVNTGGIDDGPMIEKAIFNDVTVTAAFNQLASLTGYTWRIDQYRALQFRQRAALIAPIDLDGSTLLAGSVKVTQGRDLQAYRNQQLVRAGTDLTDPRLEILVGDGARRAFATAFPVGSVPTVEESRAGAAWAQMTVGILGVDKDRDWSWNLGQAQVSQRDTGMLLAAPTSPSDPSTGDRIRVTYRGSFPVRTQYTDLAEIAARKATEGGSGIYAAVEDRPEINSAQGAIDVAVALVDRYGQISTILEGMTRSGVLEPGQVVTVNLPNHNLVDAEMLVESVTADYQSEVNEVWYSVKAISGDPFGGWQQYFRKLLDAGKSYVIGREGEVLALLRMSSEAVGCTDGVVVTTAAPESRIGYMQIGTGQIG